MAQLHYDLVYSNIRAFAEPIRMLLHHRGLAYRYWMPWDYFGRLVLPELKTCSLPH